MRKLFVIMKRSFDYVGERDYERRCYNMDYTEKLNDATKIVGYAKTISGAIALLTSYVEPTENGYHRLKDSGVCRDAHRRFLDYEFFNEDGKEKKRIRNTNLFVEERESILADCL